MALIMILLGIALAMVVLRPMWLGAPVNYQDILTLAQTTLPKHIGGEMGKFNVINECTRHDYLAGRLYRRVLMDWDGGKTIKFPLQFQRSQVGAWTHPYAKQALKGTKAPTWGEVAIRFYGWGWFKPWAELDLNKGARQVLIDLGKLARSDVALDLVESAEDAVMAIDGNYAHDGGGADFLIMFGWRFWITIDGLHIAEPGAVAPARSIAGINPGTYAAWKNPFVNPVASSDGLGAITSVYELRGAIDRMFEELSFNSLDVWGKLASDWKYQSEDPTDFNRSETPKDLMIWTDPGTSHQLKDILFDREDNVGRDQWRPRPVYHGLEVRKSSALGVNAHGFGYDAEGGELWADAEGSYAHGNWKNYGEMAILNTRYIHMAVHPDHAPHQERPYRPEGMFGIGHEGDWWPQLLCRSRRRAGAYIGPYPLELPPE